VGAYGVYEGLVNRVAPLGIIWDIPRDRHPFCFWPLFSIYAFALVASVYSLIFG